MPLLRKVIDQMEGDDGWVNLGEVGKRVTNLFPDFDSRTYGHGKLSDLVEKSGSFEIDRHPGRPGHCFVIGLVRLGTAHFASLLSLTSMANPLQTTDRQIKLR